MKTMNDSTRIAGLRIIRARQVNPVGSTADQGLDRSYTSTVECLKKEGAWTLTDRRTGEPFYVGKGDLYDVALEAIIRAEGAPRDDEDELCALALAAYRACVAVYWPEGVAQTEADLATPEGEARIEVAQQAIDAYLEASGHEPWESIP